MRRLPILALIASLACASTVALARRPVAPVLRAVSPAVLVLGSHGTPLVSCSRRGGRPQGIEVVLADGMRTTARIEWIVDELGRVTLDGEWPVGPLRVETAPAITYEVSLRPPERAPPPAPRVVRVLDRRPGLVEVVLDQPMPTTVFVVLARSGERTAWTRVRSQDARFGIGVPRRAEGGSEAWSFAFADELGQVSEWTAPIAARR